jgi:hypothetical protein
MSKSDIKKRIEEIQAQKEQCNKIDEKHAFLAGMICAFREMLEQ